MSVVVKKTFPAITLCILIAGMLIAAVPAARGQEPLNIGLLRFEAVPAEEGIRLEWDVETEIGTAGYTIKRAEGEGNSYDHLLDPGGNFDLFIFAEGGPAQAFSYVYVDESAVRERTYTYQLVEITTSAREQVQSSYTVTYHIEPTATPVTFSGDTGNPGSNNSSTQATATDTATQMPTSTPISRATSTSVPAPTRVAPTPLPSPTAVQQNVAPTLSSPPQPSNSPTPEAAYPAVDEDTPLLDTAVSDSPTVQEEIERQTEVTAEESAPEQSVVEAPQEIAQEPLPQDSAGVAHALVIKGDLNAEQKQTVPVEETGDDSPVVIGEAGSVSAATLLLDQAQQAIADEEPANVDSTRILLWVAFIVALAIFSASVIGAIYLYNRRRSV
jgi:hypothetical protein